MTKQLEYTGLKTTRTAIHGVMPLLVTSTLSNNPQNVGNNGWLQDADDAATIGNGVTRPADGNNYHHDFQSSSFTIVFE